MPGGPPRHPRPTSGAPRPLFIKKDQREAALLLDDAETRYRQLLAHHPGLEARIRQHHIASYLGITPVALSRIRARLRRVNPG